MYESDKLFGTFFPIEEFGGRWVHFVGLMDCSPHILYLAKLLHDGQLINFLHPISIR